MSTEMTVITVAEWARFAEETKRPPLPAWPKQRGTPGAPATRVGIEDAEDYCAWAGVRLPTRAELEEYFGDEMVQPGDVWLLCADLTGSQSMAELFERVPDEEFETAGLHKPWSDSSSTSRVYIGGGGPHMLGTRRCTAHLIVERGSLGSCMDAAFAVLPA